MQTPSTRPAGRGAQSFSRNFLSDVVIDYGPRDVLSRLFLKADTELREQGVELSFAAPESLIELNRLNRASWRPLVSIFNAEVGGFTNENGFVLVGKNSSGEVVVTQALRLYSLGKTTLREEAESLRLFYANPELSKGPNETCTMTCPTASNFTGRITYSGAVWYRPDYRKLGLTSIVGRVAKAYGFSKWYTDLTLTLMIEDVFAGGTAARAGFSHSEWEVLMIDTPLGSARAAIVWIEANEMLDYLVRYLDRPHSKVDAAVDDRASHQQGSVGRAV